MTQYPQNPTQYVQDLAQSTAVRSAAFELIRLWRMGWDAPGSSGYQSYVMAYRSMTDLLPNHRESMVTLARAILAVPRT